MLEQFVSMDLPPDKFDELAEARQFHADSIRQMMRGETPDYAQSLPFKPPSVQQARDGDVALIEQTAQQPK